MCAISCDAIRDLLIQRKVAPWAILFVIAVARLRNLTVITGENPTGKLAVPKIPDVAKISALLGFACSISFESKNGALKSPLCGIVRV